MRGGIFQASRGDEWCFDDSLRDLIILSVKSGTADYFSDLPTSDADSATSLRKAENQVLGFRENASPLPMSTHL